MSQTPSEAPELAEHETHPDDQNLVDREEIDQDLSDQLVDDPAGDDDDDDE